SAVWRFFPAESEGDTLYILDPDALDDPELRHRPPVLASFTFPRQPGGDRLCLADYTWPRGLAQSRTRERGGAPLYDSVCLLAVTAGTGIREVYQRFRDAGDLLLSHAIQALAVETAEAAAEW